MEIIVSKFGDEKRKTAPTGWNDLSLRDQLLVLHIMSSTPKSAATAGEILQIQRLQIARIVLNIQDSDLEMWEADCLRVNGAEHGATVFASELRDLMSVADAFYDIHDDPETGQRTFAPKLSLTKCPYPALEYGAPMTSDRKGRPKGSMQRKQLFCAKDDWGNISFYEMTHLFACVEAWAKDGDSAHVNRALAILYREAKPASLENKQAGYHNDRRRPYLHEEDMAARRERHMEKLPAEVRGLLWFWCRSCRQGLISRFKRVFSSAGEHNALNESYGWAGVLMELAGGVKDLDAVAQQPATTVLAYLSYLGDKSLVEQLQGK